MAKKEQHRAMASPEKVERETPIRAYRIPILLYSEFTIYVVKPDGRTEAEIIRSLIAEAVKRAKEGIRSK